MAIITISRGCCSHGKEIAECVARELGYDCISQEVLLETSQSLHVPEEKMFESLHDAPGFMARISHARRKFINGFQATLLEKVAGDNVVYHGFAGQILLGGIPHVLKVRVIADMEERIRLLQGQRQVDRKGAIRIIEREDRERAEWYRTFYHIDVDDPSLYDLVLHIDRLTIQDASDLVCRAASADTFKAKDASRTALADLALENRVKMALETICHAEVQCGSGIVHIRVEGQKLKSTGMASPDIQHQVQDQIQSDLYDKIVAAVADLPGVKDIDCRIDTPYFV
jgi:cytidylate kinase